MAKLYNLAAMTVASTGTGTITLGSAATINGVLYLSFAAAGVSNGETIAYSINDVGASEEGSAVYNSTGPTITRTPVSSTNGNAAINVTAAAIVRISPGKEDLANLRENNAFTGTQTISPATGTINKGLSVAQTFPSSGSSPGPVLANSITVTNPGVISSTNGIDAFGQIQQQAIGLRVNYNAAGAGTNNGAIGAAVMVTGIGDAYGAAVGVSAATPITSRDFWGCIGYVTLFPGATGIGGIAAVEGEIGIAAGASANYRVAVSANSQGPTQGSILDAAFAASTLNNVFSGGGTTSPFQHLVALSSNMYLGGAGQFPITTSGDFFFSEGAGTVAHFANLANVTVTGNILSFPNMAIGGNGTAIFGGAAGSLPGSGVFITAASSGNVQSTMTPNGVGGAAGVTIQDSSNNNVIFVGVAEASNTGTRLGQTQGNFAEVLTVGSTNAGLLLGTRTNTPVIIGTNNIERMRVNAAGSVSVTGGLSVTTQLTSTVATGTAPLVVSSTTLVANLHAATADALTTARAIDGQNFDGTAAITVIAPGTHAATSKATPVDADEIPLVDSAASNVLKKLTWANLKATLKTYFDTLYAALDNSAWTAYTPTITAQSGTFTGATIVASARYKQIGKTILMEADVLLTALGSGLPSLGLRISLPFTAAAFNFSGSSSEILLTAQSGRAVITSSGTTVDTRKYDGTTWISVGNQIIVGISYEVP